MVTLAYAVMEDLHLTVLPYTPDCIHGGSGRSGVIHEGRGVSSLLPLAMFQHSLTLTRSMHTRQAMLTTGGGMLDACVGQKIDGVESYRHETVRICVFLSARARGTEDDRPVTGYEDTLLKSTLEALWGGDTVRFIQACTLLCIASGIPSAFLSTPVKIQSA